MAEAAHERVDGRASSRLRRVLLQPLTKSGVEGLVAGLGHQTRLLNQGFVGTERYVLHTNTVYTISVRSSTERR